MTCVARKLKAAQVWFEEQETLQAHYKNIIELADNKKILVGYVRAAVKQIKSDEADQQLQASRGGNSTQDMDYFDNDDDDEDDDDDVGDNMNISEMPLKKLSEVLINKEAQKDVYQEELQEGPVKKALQEFADDMKANGKKSEGQATVDKMKLMLKNEIFKNLDASEFNLLATLCTASARKMELPSILQSLEGEIESLKKARDTRAMAEAKAKMQELDAKKAAAAKRKIKDEAAGKSCKGRKGKL